MTQVTLKATVAVIALATGSAWADTAVTGDVAPSTGDAAVQTTGTQPKADEEVPAQVDAGGAAMVDSFDGMVVSDLVGRGVIEANGESIGEVDQIFRQDGTLSAVVGVGGFLGIGEHDVAVPLSQLSRSADGELKLTSWTRAEIEAQPDIDEREIDALDANEPISGSS